MTPMIAPSLPTACLPYAEGRLVLPGGRCLGWAEFGNPDGLPLVYCHGVPGSRREAAFAAAAADRAGIRLLAFDRPGYGWSGPVPQQGLLAGAEDLERLADARGIDRFLLLGVSGGAPAAVAGAYAFPRRVSALGLVCPVGPLALLPPGTLLPLPWRLLNRAGPWLPRLTPALRPLSFWCRRRPADLIGLFARGLDPVDRDLLRDRGVRTALAASMGESCRPGAPGVAADLAHFIGPWEFSPAAVTVPVRLWLGGRDRLVPAALSEVLGHLLPRVRVFNQEQEGHFSLPLTMGEQILGDLAATGSEGPFVV